MQRMPGCMARMNLPFIKWWRTKKKIHASSSVALQTAKVTAIVCDKVLMKVEKALNFCVEDINRKGTPLYYTLLLLYLMLVMSYCA